MFAWQLGDNSIPASPWGADGAPGGAPSRWPDDAVGLISNAGCLRPRASRGLGASCVCDLSLA